MELVRGGGSSRLGLEEEGIVEVKGEDLVNR